MQSQIWIKPFLFCLVALLCSLGLNVEISQHADSHSYLIFANQILSGALLDFQQINWSTIIRTPGYPCLLALAQLVFGSGLNSISYLHFALGLLALLFFVFRLSALIGQSSAIILGFLSLFVWREHYSIISSEWSAFCSLLIFLTCLPLSAAEFTGRRLIALSLIASVLILVKPSLIAILPVISLMILLVVDKTYIRSAFVIFLVGLAPLFLWSLFNLYRLGVFNIAAVSGHNLFGTTSLLAAIKVDPLGYPRLSRFAEYVEKNKLPAPGQEWEVLSQLPENYQTLSKLQQHNMENVALKFAPEEMLSRADYDSLMKQYAWRVIKENPKAYLSLVATGVGVAKRDLWLIIVAILCMALMIKNGHQLSVLMGVSLGVHISHLVFLSIFQIVMDRTYLLTLIPLGLFTVVSMLSAIRERS
jgi:hypothetical protein